MLLHTAASRSQVGLKHCLAPLLCIPRMFLTVQGCLYMAVCIFCTVCILFAVGRCRVCVNTRYSDRIRGARPPAPMQAGRAIPSPFLALFLSRCLPPVRGCVHSARSLARAAAAPSPSSRQCTALHCITLHHSSPCPGAKISVQPARARLLVCPRTLARAHSRRPVVSAHAAPCGRAREGNWHPRIAPPPRIPVPPPGSCLWARGRGHPPPLGGRPGPLCILQR